MCECIIVVALNDGNNFTMSIKFMLRIFLTGTRTITGEVYGKWMVSSASRQRKFRVNPIFILIKVREIGSKDKTPFFERTARVLH